MDDLIAGLAGGMHVSQESYDLEAFKAALGRSLVLGSPSDTASSSSTSLSSLAPHTRPPSISMPMDYNLEYAQALPLPSPAAGYSASPFFEGGNHARTPTYNQYQYEYSYNCGYNGDNDIDVDLESAFAGDAFAPQLQKENKGVAPADVTDPWRRFREANDKKQPQFPQFAQIQISTHQIPHQHQTPKQTYAEQSDEDLAEAMVTDD